MENNNESINSIKDSVDKELGIGSCASEIDDSIQHICSRTKERLKEVMVYFDDSYLNLAEAIGISYQSLSKKLNSHVDFKRSEIIKIKHRYNLDAEQIDYIFFSE